MNATTKTFAPEHEITLEILDGPDVQSRDGWEHYAYRVELRHGARTLVTPWRQGVGITDDPDPATVLDSLISDARTVNNVDSFEDWCSELGFDTDSRKAETTYNECRQQASKLREFLGDELTDEAEELEGL